MSNSDTFLDDREGSEWVDGYGYNGADRWQEEQLHEIDKAEALTALKLFECGLTKSEIKTMASTAIDGLLETGNVLQVAESLSAMETFIKELKADKRYTDYVREEVGKIKGGYISASGAKIELAETGTDYDYEKCNDKTLAFMESEASYLASQIKARKAFLRTVPISGKDELYPDGEVIKIYAPAKASNSSYKVTLSK